MAQKSFFCTRSSHSRIDTAEVCSRYCNSVGVENVLSATATPDEVKAAYKKAGFEVIPFSQVKKSGLKRGDILLRPSNLHGGHGHTALVTNSQTRRIVHAFGDKNGRAGESGGRQEISTAPYYDGNWDYVVRWTGK